MSTFLVDSTIDLGVIAALGGRGRQVGPGHVAIDPLIEAAKLVGTLQIQDQLPAPLGFRRFSTVPMNHAVAKPQLGTLGIELQPLCASFPWTLVRTIGVISKKLAERVREIVSVSDY